MYKQIVGGLGWILDKDVKNCEMLGKYEQIQLIFRLVNYSGNVTERVDCDSPCISGKSILVNHQSELYFSQI